MLDCGLMELPHTLFVKIRRGKNAIPLYVEALLLEGVYDEQFEFWGIQGATDHVKFASLAENVSSILSTKQEVNNL